MSDRNRNGGSRFLYEPFDAASARLETHEKVLAERWNGLERRLVTMEATLERLERRLWMAVYGVTGFMLAQGAIAFMDLTQK